MHTPLESLPLLMKKGGVVEVEPQKDPVEVLREYLIKLFPGSSCEILVQGTDFKYYSRVNTMPDGVTPSGIRLTLRGGKIPEKLSIIDENFHVNQDGKVLDVNSGDIGQRLTKMLSAQTVV